MKRIFDVRWMFALACLLVLAAYRPGLQGDFLLDDTENFAQLDRYARGEVTWIGPVVSNRSGPLRRPISMASFVATVAAGGHLPWAYKVGNLFLHVSIGALVGLLALGVVRRDNRLAQSAAPIAAFIAIMWMALPIHVSTVLYPVQRMAQMSTLFLVTGLIGYVLLRQRLESLPQARGLWVALSANVIVFTALGAFSKENGLLLPLLCLALEITIFARSARGRGAAMAALTLTLFAPAAIGAIAAAFHADKLLALYETRSFTLVERLLTQPRVLWDYVGSILIPDGTRLGVYQDDFPLSRSLWEPWTTLPALIGWLAALVAAIRWRATAPAAACGVLLFLGGHAMESSVFPLEIYFEHRNYFPAIGLLLALVGTSPIVWQKVASGTPSIATFLRAVPWVWIAVLLAAVHGRALVWGSPETLMAQSEADRPLSPRVQTTLAARAMQNGDLPSALDRLNAAENLMGPLERGSSALWRLVAHCATGAPIDLPLLDAATHVLQPKPTRYGLRAAIVLADQIEAGNCKGVDAAAGFALYARWADTLQVPPRTHAAWRIRYLAGRLAGVSGQWPEALTRVQRAWEDSDWNIGIGVVVIQAAHMAGDQHSLASAIARVEATIPAWDLTQREAAQRARAEQLGPY